MLQFLLDKLSCLVMDLQIFLASKNIDEVEGNNALINLKKKEAPPEETTNIFLALNNIKEN